MHCAPSNHIQEQFNLISPFVMHIKPSRSSSIVCVWDHSHVLLVITKQRNTYSWEGLSYTLFFVYFILFRKLPELSSGFIVHAYPGGPYSSLFPPLTSFTSQPHAHFSCSLLFFMLLLFPRLSPFERDREDVRFLWACFLSEGRKRSPWLPNRKTQIRPARMMNIYSSTHQTIKKRATLVLDAQTPFLSFAVLSSGRNKM